MSQVIVSLSGGLGNQLFQYAFARAIIHRTNSYLSLDLTWFDIVNNLPDTTQRAYALAPFDLYPHRLNTYQKFFLRFGRVGQFIQRYSDEYSRKFNHGIDCYESSYTFDSTLASITCPVHLHGHWQSYKYFENITEILRKEIAVPGEMNKNTSLIYEQIKSTDSICLHIRRGDYVTNKIAANTHGLCGMQYYFDGLEIVSRKMANPKCYIFSDDPNWVRENFTTHIPMTIVDVNGPNDAHQDLWLMAACKTFVIANSSLSWWGAWLSDYSEKVVVAPRRWFLSENYDAKDLIPVDWIQL